MCNGMEYLLQIFTLKPTYKNVNNNQTRKHIKYKTNSLFPSYLFNQVNYRPTYAKMFFDIFLLICSRGWSLCILSKRDVCFCSKMRCRKSFLE